MLPEPEGLDPDFAALLASQRDSINALYHQASHYGRIEPDTVYALLKNTLQPLVLAASPLLDKPALEALLQNLLVLALDLSGKQLLGQDGPFALIESGWRRIFCAHPDLLAVAPRRVIAAVSNALVHLCLHPGAEPERWLDELERLSGSCQSVECFLKLGQVLAWRCGLAHYRLGALELVPTLPEVLRQELLGPYSLADWLANPWLGQASADERLSIRQVSGAFVGWGGRLNEPPSLAWEGDSILVFDRLGCWYLFVDAFGESWLRRAEIPTEACSSLGPWTLSQDGKISLGNQHTHLPELSGWRQAIGNAHTLAIVMPKSFKIRLVGLKSKA